MEPEGSLPSSQHPASSKHCVIFRNKQVFYSEDLITPRTNPPPPQVGGPTLRNSNTFVKFLDMYLQVATTKTKFGGYERTFYFTAELMFAAPNGAVNVKNTNFLPFARVYLSFYG